MDTHARADNCTVEPQTVLIMGILTVHTVCMHKHAVTGYAVILGGLFIV